MPPGKVVRRLAGPGAAGLHRVVWDLRWPNYRPVTGGEASRRGDDDEGFSAAEGAARWPCRGSTPSPWRNATSRARRSWLPPTAFEVEPLNFATLPLPDREAVMAFARQTGELQRAALGTLEALNDGLNQIVIIKRIIDQTPTLPLKLPPGCARPGAEAAGPARAVHRRSDQRPAQRAGPARPDRADRDHHRRSLVTTSAPTGSHRKNYEIAAAEFEAALKKLHPLLDHDLPALHETLEAAGAPGLRAGSCRNGSGEASLPRRSGHGTPQPSGGTGYEMLRFLVFLPGFPGLIPRHKL